MSDETGMPPSAETFYRKLVYCPGCDYAMDKESMDAMAAPLDRVPCPRCHQQSLGMFYSFGSATHRRRRAQWLAGEIRGAPPPLPAAPSHGHPRTGDEGQRYEHWCDDGEGKPKLLGWDNKKGGAFAKCVKHHPSWTNHRVVDRHPDKPEKT